MLTCAVCLCVCVCVEPLHFGTCVLASLSVSVHVYEHMCVTVCVYVTNRCMIYSFFLRCCCLGPSVCHANAQRSLCNWSGPVKAPAIWILAALDDCLSIRQFLLIAQSQDSVLRLSIEWLLHRLNTLICNKVWDLTSPWPRYWPDNAELGWEQVKCVW